MNDNRSKKPVQHAHEHAHEDAAIDKSLNSRTLSVTICVEQNMQGGIERIGIYPYDT